MSKIRVARSSFGMKAKKKRRKKKVASKTRRTPSIQMSSDGSAQSFGRRSFKGRQDVPIKKTKPEGKTPVSQATSTSTVKKKKKP